MKQRLSSSEKSNLLARNVENMSIVESAEWIYVCVFLYTCTRGVQMNFALSWFPSSYSSELPLVFQHSLTWHQYKLANDIRVLRSFRKIRLKHAPLRSRQQPPWRHCRFQISSVAVHISFSEANSNPRVLSHENKEEAEAFHSHTPLMTSEFWLGASSCISSTPDVSLWRRLALIALRGFFICYTEVLPATVFSCSK